MANRALAIASRQEKQECERDAICAAELDDEQERR